MTKQIKANIEAIDKQIATLMEGLDHETEQNKIEEVLYRIDKLTKIRKELVESKVNGSYSKEIVSGLFSVGAMILVLKHEQTDAITTKAFSMVTRLFRGN